MHENFSICHSFFFLSFHRFRQFILIRDVKLSDNLFKTIQSYSICHLVVISIFIYFLIIGKTRLRMYVFIKINAKKNIKFFYFCIYPPTNFFFSLINTFTISALCFKIFFCILVCVINHDLYPLIWKKKVEITQTYCKN